MSKQNVRINLWIGVALLALVFLSFGIWYVLYPKTGDQIRITVDGDVYGTYDLDTNQEIEVVIQNQVTNVVVIEDGVAYMREASCPDLLCVHQGKIHSSGQSIICLPNRVVVTVISSEEPSVEVTAR